MNKEVLSPLSFRQAIYFDFEGLGKKKTGEKAEQVYGISNVA